MQSPAWVWGEALWFKAFGVGLVQARWFVVVHSLAALVLLFWLALVRHGLPAAVTATLLLGLNWAYLVYSRLALMEGALIAWLLLATVALSQLDRRPQRAGLWIAVATGSMVVACLIKQTALLLLPAFAIALPLLALRAVEPRHSVAAAGGLRAWLAPRWRRWPSLFAAAAVTALIVGLGLLIVSPEYQERLAFNAAHFTAADDDESLLGRAGGTLLRGLFSRRLQLMFFLLAPLCLWLATLELGRLLAVGWRRWRAARSGSAAGAAQGLFARADVLELWMLAWAILALLANLASPHRAIRFQLIMLPPAAWLGGVLVARLWAHPWSPRWRPRLRVVLCALGLACVGWTSLRVATWMRHGQPTAARLGGQREALIGDRHAVVVGEFAAQAVLDSDYWHFYLRPHQFNDSPEIIATLGPTHLVVHGDEDFVLELLREASPELLLGRRHLGWVNFRGVWLSVWELLDASQRAELIEGRETVRRESRLAARRERQRERAEARSQQGRESRARQCLPAALRAVEPAPGYTPVPGAVRPPRRVAD